MCAIPTTGRMTLENGFDDGDNGGDDNDDNDDDGDNRVH